MAEEERKPVRVKAVIKPSDTTRIGAVSLDGCTCPRCGHVYSPPPEKPLKMFACLVCKHPFWVPGRIPGFQLMEQIGSGEMGEIYRAKDETLGREVAIKIICARYANDDASRERLRQEARAAARLNHPRVAQIFSLGFLNGQPYVAMELVPGEDLKVRIDRTGRVDERVALIAVLDVAEGLVAMHAAGIAHGDIKPGNIVLDRSGRAKLVDFGLSGMTRNDGTGGIVGTPNYIAPELLRGASDNSRSDIYSLGATLYHVLTGQPPYDGKSAEDVVKALLTQPIVPVGTRVPGISLPLQRIVMRMLERDPAKRYQECSELAHDLRLALKRFDVPEASTPAPPAVPVAPPAPFVPPVSQPAPLPHPSAPPASSSAYSTRFMLSKAIQMSEPWEYALRKRVSRLRARRRMLLGLISVALLALSVWAFEVIRERRLSQPETTESPSPLTLIGSFFARLGTAGRSMVGSATLHETPPVPTLLDLVPADAAFVRTIVPAWLTAGSDEGMFRGSTIWLSRTAVVLQGDGVDALSGASKCRFVQTSVSGAYAFSARVLEIASTHERAQTGIMARSGNPDTEAGIFFGFLGYGSMTMQVRMPHGNTASNVKTVPASSEGRANHLRLERKGSEFRAFYSMNGKDWTPFAACMLDLPDNCKVGVVVASHISGAFAIGKFDDFRLWGLDPATRGESAVVPMNK